MKFEEQTAQRILEKEGYIVTKHPLDKFPDFESECGKFFEIKSIGNNNQKIPFKISTLKNIGDRIINVIVIDRRTQKECLRFKISDVHRSDEMKQCKNRSHVSCSNNRNCAECKSHNDIHIHKR